MGISSVKIDSKEKLNKPAKPMIKVTTKHEKNPAKTRTNCLFVNV